MLIAAHWTVRATRPKCPTLPIESSITAMLHLAPYPSRTACATLRSVEHSHRTSLWIFYLNLALVLLTSFFGTYQKDDKWKECQVENGDGARRKGIGHGVVPIRRLGVYGQVLIQDGLSLESGVFCLLKLVS